MSRGTEWIELWDGRRWPGRVRDGLPEFGFGLAPAGLSTRRQLRARGLCRGGQEPFARLVWKRERRFAWLYVDDKAKAKRTATAKQLAAVEKALAARKVCTECGPVEHYVRTTDGLCGDCHAAGIAPARTEPATWQQLHDWQAAATQPTNQTEDEDDDEVGQEVGDVRSPPQEEADAAVRRAAASVHRLTHDTNQQDDDRDELVARWHADDQAADRAAEMTDGQWPALERGVA